MAMEPGRDRMSWNNKVVWSEGMFLRPVHFQQQERHVQNFVQSRVTALRPYGWGFIDLRIDEELLAMGKIALASARGVFADGTPFNLPGDEDMPTPLDIPEGAVDSRVLLALPVRRQNMEEAIPAERSDSHARYRYSELEVSDNNAGVHANVTLQVGKLRLRLLLEGQDLGAMTVLPFARVVERKIDMKVELDPSFIPPSMNCQAIAPLQGCIEEIQGLLHHRGQVMAERLAQPGKGGVAEIAHFLLLQTVNRFEPWFAHASRRFICRAVTARG
jgi:type VI secretion system protein ImpJ